MNKIFQFVVFILFVLLFVIFYTITFEKNNSNYNDCINKLGIEQIDFCLEWFK